MPTYNIIGDIHRRDSWERLDDENCINLFIGDYFDPYQDFAIDELERNFLEMTHQTSSPVKLLIFSLNSCSLFGGTLYFQGCW